MRKKVAVAMSGGVDSGVAAALLVERGFSVLGLHLHLWAEEFDEKFLKKLGKRWENKCCSTESLEAARKTAGKLKIPFYVLDYGQDFKKIVVDYFLGEYKRGRTPNPCVVCNQFIRFGKLLEYVRSLGCEYLATGHYARIVKTEKPRQKTVYHLLQGIDKKKDQSYFLWTLTQKKLAHILFPVGGFYKEQVRKIAREKKLPVAARPESMEICFTPERDYRAFIRRHIPGAIKPGEVVDTKGNVVGRHFGLPLYTIGQRKGFEINIKYQKSKIKYGIPLYVVGMDVRKNRLIVGRGEESERRQFVVSEVNWIEPGIQNSKTPNSKTPKLQDSRTPKLPPSPRRGRAGQNSNFRCFVRIRHQGELLKCEIKTPKLRSSKTPNRLLVELEEGVRGVTPGQSAVFYRGEEVLGGGVIE